ncbi:MAG: hypothetical protein QF464_14895, partial [Myxococcota bacterium]|nr:hypothetical protein [Myxococcota bacterium]
MSMSRDECVLMPFDSTLRRTTIRTLNLCVMSIVIGAMLVACGSSNSGAGVVPAGGGATGGADGGALADGSAGPSGSVDAGGGVATDAASSGGGTSKCPTDVFLDMSKAAGAGGSYAKPTLS